MFQVWSQLSEELYIFRRALVHTQVPTFQYNRKGPVLAHSIESDSGFAPSGLLCNACTTAVSQNGDDVRPVR
jgi:hypothetical protein